MKSKAKKQPKHAIQPARGFVLVRSLPEEEFTEGGLYKPDVSKEKPQEAVVVAIHPESAYKVGDVVVHLKYAGAPIRVNDEDLLILKEREEYLGDILGTKETL